MDVRDLLVINDALTEGTDVEIEEEQSKEKQQQGMISLCYVIHMHWLPLWLQGFVYVDKRSSQINSFLISLILPFLISLKAVEAHMIRKGSDQTGRMHRLI